MRRSSICSHSADSERSAHEESVSTALQNGSTSASHGTCVVELFSFGLSLSASAIRDAYFQGTRAGGVSLGFIKRYSLVIDDLYQGTCVSSARVETPFLQVAEQVGSVPNYSAQDAIKEFYGRALPFRMFLNICYQTQAPPPGSVKLRFTQDKKEISPISDKRTSYAEPAAEGSFLEPNGETAELEFDPTQLDSTPLTVGIVTPDGEHTKVTFDLASLR